MSLKTTLLPINKKNIEIQKNMPIKIVDNKSVYFSKVDSQVLMVENEASILLEKLFCSADLRGIQHSSLKIKLLILRIINTIQFKSIYYPQSLIISDFYQFTEKLCNQDLDVFYFINIIFYFAHYPQEKKNLYSEPIKKFY